MSDENLVDTSDLITQADLAREFGVTRATVSNWAKRHDDFPRPVFGAILPRAAALKWVSDRRAAEQAKRDARPCTCKCVNHR